MRKSKLSIKPYTVKRYQFDCLNEFLKPPEKMTVSEWAEKFRMLDSKISAMPGRWRNSVTPYLVGVMDAFMDYAIEEIYFCKPTQCGGSEALLNMIGYLIAQDPGPTLVVYPTETTAKSISGNRVHPMMELSPALRDKYIKNESSLTEIQFSNNMYLSLAWANSAAELSSKSIRYLFLDEVDKYPPAAGKEASPINLARERTKTFESNRKIYVTSTPTTRDGHIWKTLQSADEERHYFVPCPHCGEMIELKWAQVKFSDDETLSYQDRAETAHYECQLCGGIITDADKPKMLLAGEWRAVRKSAKVTRRLGFWMNTLYSPFVRFSQAANEFLKSKDDPAELQNFVNSWLAEPWEDTRLRTNADLVLDRQTDTPMGMVPVWAKFLTGGVDVQETSLYWTIRAWGPHLTSQNIAHGQAYSFDEVDDVMSLSYDREDGEKMVVRLCLVDSGFADDNTYEFCLPRLDWALPVKGASNPLQGYYKVSKVNKQDSRAYGIPLVFTDGDKYKDMIAARMMRENGRGSWMVYDGCDREYAEQVTAEHKVNIKTAGGRYAQKWVPKHSHIDNHYLDTEVYALAAADLLDVRLLYLQDEEHRKITGRSQKPEPVQEETPEESWIQQNEISDWLGGG